MRSDRALRRPSVVAWAVALLAGGLLTISTVLALVALPTDDFDGAAEQYDQLQCMERLLHERIPAGATVAIDRPEHMRAADPTLPDISASYWYQRLTELAYPRLDPAISPIKAEYTAGLEAPYGQGECNGVGLRVISTESEAP